MAQETAAEGVWYTPLGLHDLRKRLTDMKTGEKKVTEVKLKSLNEPIFFSDKCIIGTARSDGHYQMLFSNRDR